jgi:hypothetical protein
VTWREDQTLAPIASARLKGACIEESDYRASRGLDKSVVGTLPVHPVSQPWRLCSSSASRLLLLSLPGQPPCFFVTPMIWVRRPE